MSRLRTTLTLLLVAQSYAGAAVIMDQIGPNGTFTNGQSTVHSQVMEPANASLADTAVDNFAVTGTTRLTQLEAVVALFGGGTVFTGITEYRVAIYSSINAAAASQVGDVANLSIATGSVTLDTAFTGVATRALATVPIDVTLNAGTYFIALLPVMNLTPFGQIGVRLSSFAGTPGDNNGFIVNPGGGGGFPNNRLNTNEDLAYRLTSSDTAVPEPGTMLLTGLGVAGLLLTRLRRG